MIIDQIIKWWYTKHGTKTINGREATVYMYKGQYHRENGPAIKFNQYTKEEIWYYKGKKINCSSQKEFERKIKLLAFS